jgi:SAM-dependent methyltransferase
MTPTTTPTTTTFDEARAEAFMGQLAVEAGAAMNAALICIGDELGLYRAMADAEPVTSAALAARTATHEAYVREWLNAQAAGGFVTYDAATATYTLPLEHAIALADEHSPLSQAGLFEAVTAAIGSHERVARAFRTGEGVGWHEHHHGVPHGVARLFAVGYRTSLVADWIPALDGVEARLRAGASVADVGCGHGESTILLAQAFPRSRFVGFDLHAESIATARRRAREECVEDRVSFDVAGASDFPGEGYDFVAHFDCLHDLGDPVAAARRVRETLADDGTWMVVEPLAGDRVEDNLHPLGRLDYGFSTLVCTPGSLAQPGRMGLGTQAGEARLTEVIRQGGFASVRRVAETETNMVLEARP